MGPAAIARRDPLCVPGVVRGAGARHKTDAGRVSQTEAGSDADDVGVDVASARALLSRIMHDPKHLSEILATYGVGKLGSRAAKRIGDLRSAHPEWTVEQYRAETLRRGLPTVISRGVLVVGPLLVLAPYGFCAALMAQNRIVLELASLAGRDPASMDRAAELLALQDAHPDVTTARAALAEAKRQGPAPPPDMGKLRTLWMVTARLAYLLGLVSRDQEGEQRVSGRVRALRWGLVFVVFFIGLVLPLVWMPYMADSYRQSTDRITKRAERFYFGTTTAVHHTRDRDSNRLALVSVLITVGLVVLTLLLDIQIFGRTWVAVVVAVLVGSVAGTALGVLAMRRRARKGD